MYERPTYTAHLNRAVSLSDQTRHLEFEVKEAERFDFAPGQFVSMLADNQGKHMTRAYSIASSPQRNRFDLCLNRVESGFFSNLLCDLSEGEELKFHGPHGTFVLRDPLRDSLMIATGTGIAPMRGFIQWLFSDESRHSGRELWLIYGTRHEKNIYYRGLFEKAAREHSNFHYVVTLSRPDESWQGARGYVQDQVRAILNARPPEARANMDAYICGLNHMVSANRKLLKEEFHWDKKSIIYERYD